MSSLFKFLQLAFSKNCFAGSSGRRNYLFYGGPTDNFPQGWPKIFFPVWTNSG